MGVQPGEAVLIVVDEPLAHVRDRLLAEALTAQPGELWSYTFADSSRPFREYLARLLHLAQHVDVVILLLAGLEPAAELPAWVAAREAIRAGPARFGAGAYIDQGILDHELSADYTQIASQTQAMARWLSGRTAVHITTALGTDLRLSLAGREWRTDTGVLRGRGVYGNLPAGEVYAAPVEDSAQGQLVIDTSFPGLVLDEPVRLRFERGRLVHIDGGRGAEYLHEAIASAEQKPGGEGARVLAELGIGTNPQARLQGNIITDEKAAGTVHLAIGRNDFIGGQNIAPIHIDGVVARPTLRVDGDLLLEEGRVLLTGSA